MYLQQLKQVNRMKNKRQLICTNGIVSIEIRAFQCLNLIFICCARQKGRDSEENERQESTSMYKCVVEQFALTLLHYARKLLGRNTHTLIICFLDLLLKILHVQKQKMTRSIQATSLFHLLFLTVIFFYCYFIFCIRSCKCRISGLIKKVASI